MNAALRAPFPYFGGKRRVAARVWEALGNVEHYVEPFCGSAAVLLGRPHVARCETINDADGMVANFWRAVAADPDAVARHVDWPVNEADLHARHRWLIGQRVSLTERLIENPWWFDAQVAGWWCWGACAWIGDGWCANTTRKLIHLGDEGRGVNAPSRQLIHVGNEGRGVNAPSRQSIHVGNEGMGVHAPRRGAGVADDDAGVVDVREWMRRLQARLRPVRVACGDWHRVVASPTTLFPAGRGQSSYRCGVFLDAPYSEGAADYAVGGTGTALQARVQAWALEHGDDPRLRIVVAGYEGEHEALQRAGWRVEGWKTKGGYASQNEDGNANQRRERLWLSPHCEGGKQRSLFDALGGSR